jgi:hypothetical protein
MVARTYALGEWPSNDSINAALALASQQITRIEPWYQGIEQRGYARVYCAHQDATATARYQTFFNLHPGVQYLVPSDGHTYNNTLLISLSNQAGHGEFYTLSWADQDEPNVIEEYDAAMAALLT